MTEATTTTTGPVITDTIIQISPADVRIEDNIRTAADLNSQFVDSIKRHGVLLPVIGYRDTDGTIVIRDGQLRVLAARETSRDTIPVYLTDRDTTNTRRITEQLVTNEHRTALTDGERVAAYRQLELAGLSITKIATETGTRRDTIKTALAVAGSDAATRAVTDRQLTLDAALVFAEFSVMWTPELGVRSGQRLAGLKGWAGCGLRLSEIAESSATFP